MPRETPSSNKIALLATGDEISVGDILNTNSQIIAQKLFKNGMNSCLQMVAPDNISEIQQAIEFLLEKHRALIMTGGLGPTSDDITRYALSQALNLPLIFNEETWAAICERFKVLGYKEAPPEGNRQQALFPDQAIIIPNPQGTAAGCMIHFQDKIIFMLPGPPTECLPMVDDVVLPTLKQHGFQGVIYYDHWLLFGVSEGQIAEELDAIAQPFDCITGYRLFYPYIEFKIHSNNQNDFEALLPFIQEKVSPYIFGDGKITASERLLKKLPELSHVLSIRDFATGGLLENTLKTPATYLHLDFFPQSNATITIKGLDAFWQNKTGTQTSLEIQFMGQKFLKKQIPFRGSRVKQYALELICHEIYQFLTKANSE